MPKRLFLASLIALGAATGGHAQIAAEHPRFCVMNVGPTQMMFSAFQENRTDAIFCQNVPELGKTMIILDARSNELREMNIEIRLLKNLGQQDWRDDLDAATVAVLPPRKYLEARGTASFNYDFAREGDYIALVRATSDDGAKEYVGRYYFTVGASYEATLATGALAAAASCAGLVMWRRSSAAKSGRRAKGASSAARQST